VSINGGETMKNITLEIDDETLTQGREYAEKHHMSFDTLVKKSLKNTIRTSPKTWLNDMFEKMDKDNVSSDGQKWTKEELYRG
jgi:hypothetical protein